MTTPSFDESVDYNGPLSGGETGSENLMNSSYTQFGALGDRMNAANRGVIYIVDAAGNDKGRVFVDDGNNWIDMGRLLDRRFIVSTMPPQAGQWSHGDIWIQREA